ncbi:hypothetical protein [Stenotrophomonas sp. PD6]|uniref:hypothetical protein n=1 Tax=Stenotrophomonas sp. PD6 TaxID=3368612 RepID=UPI003B9F7619
MPIRELPRVLAPTGALPLTAASNRRAGLRTALDSSLHSIANAPRLQAGRVSSMIRLFERGANEQKAPVGTGPWAAARVPAPPPYVPSSPAASSVSSSPTSSGYASRSLSVSSDARPMSAQLRAALDDHRFGPLSAVEAESDFHETFTREELAAMDERFRDEDADIARFDHAFAAQQAAPLAEHLRAALDHLYASQEIDSDVDSDFDEVHSDEDIEAFSLRFAQEDRDIESADAAFEAQRLGHEARATTGREVNAVHAQLLDVLNSLGEETYL